MPAHCRPIRALAGALAGALLASVVLLVVGVASAAPRAWTVLASFPPPVAYMASVSCFSVTGCVAVGWGPSASDRPASSPIELRTVDGGSLWSPVPVPLDVHTLAAVVCQGSVCVAGGDGPVVLRSTDDGLTWTSVALPSTMAVVTAVACPSATACVAEGRGAGTAATGVIAGSTDGGATWTTQYAEATTSLHSLWCASPTRCFAYGTSFVATSDGSTWGAFAAPDAFPTLAVCPSTTACVGSSPSAGIVTSSDGGQTWTPTDGAVVPTALACGSASSCVGTDGSSLVLTTDGGATWSEVSPTYTSQTLAGVACSSSASCQVVGFATSDAYADRALMLDVAPDTQAYAPERVANALDAAGSATCATPTTCAVGAVDAFANPVLLRTSNGGTTWAELVPPGAVALEDQVLCTASAACLVVGSDVAGEGAVWRTTDGGQHWTSGAVPGEVGEVNRVSCGASSRCVATAYLTNSWTAVLTSANGGRTWSVASMPHSATDLYGAVCSTSHDCVAVGGRGPAAAVAFTSTDGGRRWRAARVLGGMRALDAVVCLSSKVCLAASSVRRGAATHGVVARSTNGGATWAPVSAPGDVAMLDAITCWSAVSCEAVGQTTAAANPLVSTAAAAISTTNAGRTWSAQAVPKDQWSLAAVSCARSGMCLAVGTGSFAPPNLPTGATILRLP